MMTMPGFLVLVELVMVLSMSQVGAITNNGGNKSQGDAKLELVEDAGRREFTVYTDHVSFLWLSVKYWKNE